MGKKIQKIEKDKPVAESTESKKKFTKEKPLIIVDKTDDERFHLQVREYKGFKLVDFRTYYFAEDEVKEETTEKVGQWRPTKKGISIREDQFDFFMKGFFDLVATVDFRDTPAEVTILKGKDATALAISAGVDVEDAKQTILIFNDLRREEIQHGKDNMYQDK